MRNLVLAAALFSFLLTGASVFADRGLPRSTSEQHSEQRTKTVEGKVTSMGSGGYSFTLEVNTGDTKKTMHFNLIRTAKIEGHVKRGTAVRVEYAAEQGQNIALSVTTQG